MPYHLSSARVLDFDCENRPLSYWTDDRPSAELTAVAWSWIGSRKVECWVLGEADLEEVLEFFVDAYNEADIVTGHYIRKHDLPLVNGALLELGLPTLEQKLASDTKLDLVKKLDLPVAQEALAQYMGVKLSKVHMTQADWRDANRLTPTGVAKTRKRAVGDVKQHKAMREELLRRNLLKVPKMWTP